MDFGKCFLANGQCFDPTITTQGPITTPEALYLGKQYNVFEKGKRRRVRIVKNTHSDELSACQLVKYSTSTGRFRKDVVLSTTEFEKCAGFVEDGYTGGVPVGSWFRMVEYAEQHEVILQTTSGAEATIAVGGGLQASGDDGKVRTQVVDAAGVRNELGLALEATTNGVTNVVGAGVTGRFDAEINIRGSEW